MEPAQTSLSLQDKWLARMRDLHVDCAMSAADEEIERIREAAWLLPRGHRWHWACPLSYNFHQLETMLSFRAFESAALALVSEELSYLVERRHDGEFRARVALNEGGEDIEVDGATFALALLGAHIAALVADCEQGAELDAQVAKSETA